MTPEQFRQWRKLMRLTQPEAAKALGVSFSTIQKWEKGTNPIGLHIALACAALHLNLKPENTK